MHGDLSIFSEPQFCVCSDDAIFSLSYLDFRLGGRCVILAQQCSRFLPTRTQVDLALLILHKIVNGWRRQFRRSLSARAALNLTAATTAALAALRSPPRSSLETTLSALRFFLRIRSLTHIHTLKCHRPARPSALLLLTPRHTRKCKCRHHTRKRKHTRKQRPVHLCKQCSCSRSLLSLLCCP